MANESDAGLAPVTNTRQVTIDALCEHFANDIMSIEEVESQGIAIMGGFEHKGDEYHNPDPHAPTLRITGLAIMGGVEVTVRLPGETARDARRRRKLERRERRRLMKGG